MDSSDMKMMRTELLTTLLLTLICFANQARGQQADATSDPLRQRVGGVMLVDQDVVDGFVSLANAAGLPVSVEYQLGKTISSAAPQPKEFTATIGPGTVSETLDKLSSLDEAFTWRKSDNMINVLPRAAAIDPNYFVNRRMDEVTFHDVRQADEAVMKMVDQLAGPREQIAVMDTGMSVNFGRPWSTTVRNVTVRDVFNLIARQLCPTCGWEFAGAQDFRIVTFHQHLMPRPSRSEHAQSREPGVR
jgi:hypothetical protein